MLHYKKILKDWQWADEASDLALNHLVGMVASYPLILIVLYRPEYKSDWGSSVIQTPLVLKPLGQQNSEAIVKALL